MTPAEIADSVRQANAFVAASRAKWVVIDVVDAADARSGRAVIPLRIEWFAGRWQLVAVDVAQGEERTFALAGIHAWRPY